jgi:uncharacterized membrane protein YphA (DoxX/SURF4 family)
MSISSKLDQLHLQARENKWLRYFAVLNRIGLAVGFLPSGMVKIVGDRFTALPNKHPMGAYLEALHHTGFYYPFIGVLQVTAALLLLIPRTATLGALIYFPIILNICILSIAVRFEGSLLSSPLMVLGNLYLLCWDYHKLKFLFPFQHTAANRALEKQLRPSSRFPTRFFAGVAATVMLVALLVVFGFGIKPRVSLPDCKSQCEGSDKSQACLDFCDCVYNQGLPLEKCLDAYNKAPKDAARTP